MQADGTDYAYGFFREMSARAFHAFRLITREKNDSFSSTLSTSTILLEDINASRDDDEEKSL